MVRIYAKKPSIFKDLQVTVFAKIHQDIQLHAENML